MIHAEGLTKRFGDLTAVDGVTLDIGEGEVFGFLGPNGAGKTTTLKMFTDLIFPTEGEARINGVSVQQDRKRALSVCGDLVESPEIYPSLTPREALEMSGAIRGMRPEEIRSRTSEVLAEVKMTEWADHKVGRFSKGMKQRVNVAASLLSDPEVVILDEPSTGLDPRGMAEVRNIVRGLKKENRLIFMSSHILSEVVDVCDEVALIDHGRLLFYDTLDNVSKRLNANASSVELSFLKPVPEATLTAQVAPLPGVTSVTLVAPQRARVLIAGGPERQADVLERIAGLHLGLVSFEPSKSALEELYLQEISKGD